MKNNYLRTNLFLFLFLFTRGMIFSQKEEIIINKTYKTIDTTSLEMDIHYPETFQTDHRLPVIIFFFGGGWNGG